VDGDRREEDEGEQRGDDHEGREERRGRGVGGGASATDRGWGRRLDRGGGRGHDGERGWEDDVGFTARPGTICAAAFIRAGLWSACRGARWCAAEAEAGE
jgi:hypothetical protein